MSKQFRIGEFELDAAARRLRRRDGEHVHLANRPFQVLLHLVANRGRLVPRVELLEQYWDGRDVYEDALTRCLSTVRKALDDQGDAPRFIETRWAEGYRFVGPCEEVAPRSSRMAQAADAGCDSRPACRRPRRVGSSSVVTAT
jgi:DNA-binding winged helix-turn-helix (wHTH) protein